MNKKKIDHNSSINQEIKGKFVTREVKTCFSYEMEAILRAGQEGQSDKEYPLPSYEDIVNLYDDKCPECGEVLGSTKDQNEKGIKCPYCKERFDESEQEAKEIYEWWIVTEWLAKKLQDKGEAILDWGNNFYWGRTCTGQAILLDGVISEICEEMEILEGQKYDWSK